MRLTLWRVLAACSATLLVTAAGALAAQPAAAASCLPGFSDAGGGWCSADFLYSGAPANVTLPAGGWYAVKVDARGAQGGDSREDGIGQSSTGGKGGREAATVVRSGGTALTLIVGQLGWNTQGGGVPIPGGYGGGGTPGSVYGGGGGGGSYVFDDNGPIVIAGGGGGGGWDANPTWSGGIFSQNQQAPGGNGAGAVGPAADGQSVAFCCDTTTPPPPHYAPGGGAGATASGPGAGGVPGTPPNYVFGQMPGETGQGPAIAPNALGLGGNGGGSSGGSGCFSTWSAGGGGGYYGGGGGGDIPCDLEGGGGGGGIGYVDPHATSTTSSTGVQPGDGIITLSYAATSAPTWPIVTANPVDTGVVAGTQFSFSAAASGTPAPTVQWQSSVDGGATFSDITGATSTTYGATATLADDGTRYRAVFTNTAGSATTTAALLTVTAPTSTTNVVLSVKLPTPVFGEMQILTATVTSPATGKKKVVAGSIDFLDGATLLATVPVTNGKATLRIRSLAAGDHALTASYSGAAPVDPGVSTVVPLTVTPATTTVVLAGPISGKTGLPRTYTATVRNVAPAKGPATGDVTFVDGTTPLATVALVAFGNSAKATLTVPSFDPGVHVLTVEYHGDGNHTGGTSLPKTVTVR